MRDSPRLPGKPAIVALFAVGLCALLAAATLSVVVLAEDGPERCCPAAGAESGRPSPTSRTASSREAGPPMCLIGSWRSVDETLMFKFYNDQPPLQLVGGGRQFEFRPDGTGVERQDNLVLTGTFRGNQLRIVASGAVDFTWKATDNKLTYLALTGSTATWSFYDQRGFLTTNPVPTNPNYNNTEDYTCQPAQASESDATEGYRANWVRTTAFGVYG